MADTPGSSIWAPVGEQGPDGPPGPAGPAGPPGPPGPGLAEFAANLTDGVTVGKGDAMVGHGAGTVETAINALENIQAIGPPSTQSDPQDIYAPQRRFFELEKAASADLDAKFESRAFRGPKRVRAVQVARSTASAIVNSALVAATWDQVVYDNEIMFAAGTPSRITIPANVSLVRVTANLSFDINATGVRSIHIYKNGVEIKGGRQSVNAVNGIATSLKIISDPIQVVPGDYFEIWTFQNSGGSLNINSFSTFSVELLQWQSQIFESNRLLISQGLYQSYQNGDGITDSNLETMAAKMAVYGVVVLSHVADYNSTGCVDAKYPFISRLIRTIRAINPAVKIFGYIEGTASAPSGCGYAPGSTYLDTGWTVPTPTKEIARMQMWNNIPGARPDGIFIDLVADVYMASAHRDNIYSAIKGLGFAIMSNSTYPSTANVAFACNSRFFGAGDYCLTEGFSVGLGASTAAGTADALVEIAKWRHKGIRYAALTTEAWAAAQNQTTNPASANNTTAKGLFTSNYFRGDVYQYDTGDLGIVTKIVQDPGI